MSLKELLVGKGMPISEVEKFLTYVNGERRKEAQPPKPGKDKKTPVTNNTDEMLLTMALKFWKMGLTIDGINVVITGKDMAMVTYHGYKNTLLHVYPETEIDMQLVREGDAFSLSKESGSIIYSHQINDPFGNKTILGAYVVIKNKRGEFVETLNNTDYEEMKKASKQSYLWNTWASEFWLKSVIKRACKRHFNDIVADIDKNDNEDFGQAEGVSEIMEDEEIEMQIQKAVSSKDFSVILAKLTPKQKQAVTPLISNRRKELQYVNAS